jgi:hypothetical protein
MRSVGPEDVEQHHSDVPRSAPEAVDAVARFAKRMKSHGEVPLADATACQLSAPQMSRRYASAVTAVDM